MTCVYILQFSGSIPTATSQVQAVERNIHSPSQGILDVLESLYFYILAMAHYYMLHILFRLLPLPLYSNFIEMKFDGGKGG